MPASTPAPTLLLQVGSDETASAVAAALASTIEVIRGPAGGMSTPPAQLPPLGSVRDIVAPDLSIMDERTYRARAAWISAPRMQAQGGPAQATQAQKTQDRGAKDRTSAASRQDAAAHPVPVLVPVLVIVDPGRLDDWARGLHRPVDDLLTRPLQPAELRFRVQDLLGQDRLGQDRLGQNLLRRKGDASPEPTSGSAFATSGPGSARPALPLPRNRRSDGQTEKGPAIDESEGLPDPPVRAGTNGHCESHPPTRTGSSEEAIQKGGREAEPGSSSQTADPTEHSRLRPPALPAGEERGWRNLAEVHPDPILVTVHGEIVYVNPAGVDLLQAERRDDVIGVSLATFVDDEQVLDALRNRQDRIEAGQATAPMTHEIVDLDGGRRFVDVSSTPMSYRGKPAAQTVLRDRTEERAQHRALLDRCARLHGLAHSIPGVLYNFRVEPSGEYTSSFISPQAEDLLGVSAEPTGTFFERFVERVPASHRAEFAASVSTAVENEESWAIEVPFARPDGSRIWLQCRSHPERRGDQLVFSGVLLEITERKAAEKALEDREARLQGLAGSVPGVIYQFYARPGPEYGLYYVSPQAESVLGLDPAPGDFFERFVGQVVGGISDDLRASIDRAAETVEPWSFLMPFEKPDGEIIWVEGNAAPEQRDGEVVFNGVLLDVTDRQRARRALQRERSRLHTLFETLPTPVIRCTVSDDGAHLQAANEAFGDVFGLDPHRQQGEPVEPHIVPDGSAGEAVRVNREALQTGSLEAEVRRRTVEGIRDFQLQVAGRPEADPPEVFSIYTDITDQKRQERRARRRRRKTEALYTATRTLLATRGRTEVADVITDLVRDTFEYPGVVIRLAQAGVLQPVRVAGTSRFTNLTVPPVAVDGPSPLAEAFRSGTAVCYDDLHRVSTSCTAADVLRSAACIPLDGHGVLVVGAFEAEAISEEDVRLLEILAANAAAVLDRIDQQSALERSESTYRGIIDRARDSIYVLNREGRFVSVNASTARMLGTTVDDLIGRPITDVLDTARTDPADATERLERAFAGDIQRFELWEERADGSSFPKDVRLQRAEYFGQTVVLGVGRDIEARKQREQALREAKERADAARQEADGARKEAEEANEMKSAFLANMSHEIRTPLTSIIGFAEAIGSEAGDATDEDASLDRPTLVRFAGLIEKSGQQLMEMLNGVLNLSKLEAGEMGLEPEPLDLSEEVRDVAEAFELRAEENGLRVRIEAPAEPVRARANGQGVQIVLRNLLSNAIKYTEKGGTVWVRSRRLRAPGDDAPTGAGPPKDDQPLEDGRRAKDAPAAVLEVEDTGIGMNADFLDQAFDAFHQESRGRTRKFEGTGLGLAVVAKTVTSMNGCVEVDSQKGEGTRVTVRLPAAEA